MALFLPLGAAAVAGGSYFYQKFFAPETEEGGTGDREGDDEHKKEETMVPAAAAAATNSEVAEEEQHYSQAERMLRDAVLLYRARRYHGTITISHKVGIFTETCSLCVHPSGAPDLHSDDETPGAALATETLLEEQTKVGRAFEALLGRLERRAAGWEAMDKHGLPLDPVLGASATLGFNLPMIKVGWGLTIALSITKSSLLRWARRDEHPTRSNGAEQDDVAAAIEATSAALLTTEDS